MVIFMGAVEIENGRNPFLSKVVMIRAIIVAIRIALGVVGIVEFQLGVGFVCCFITLATH